MATLINLKDNILRYKYNPSLIQQAITDHLSDVTDGKVDLVDASNPFVFSLEALTVAVSAFLTENEINTRRQYPAAAQTEADIYIHMSDEDFIDRFAVPASTKFTILVRKDDLLENMVNDISTGTRKVVIPRDTFFTVNDVVFTMLYPVEIRELSHGGLQIVYDTDTTNPLKELTTNIIKWDVRKASATGEEWLYLEVDAEQFKVESYSEEVTSAVGFNRSYEFTDSFYHVRVWNKSNSTGGVWKEILTTHTDQVYDVKTATAVIRVDSSLKTVGVYIPQVYLTSGKVTGSIRTDIYDTKGRLVMMLDSYSRNSFETSWTAIDGTEINQFTAPLTSIRTIFAYSAESVDGGRAALTFDELRDRVIKNSVGPQQLPITNVQLESFLSNNNYTIVKDVDVVTNRIYLASRAMPDPFDEKLITAGNSSIETLITSMDSLTNYPFIRDNGSRMTIPSNTLFTNDNGIINLITLQAKSELLLLNNEAFVQVVNSKKYLYNPFHYVLDSSLNEFELRAYYLDTPSINAISFIDQNDSTGLEINTNEYDIIKDDTGFIVRTKVQSSAEIKAMALGRVGAQLSFVPQNGVRCSVTGTPTIAQDNGELIFEFALESNFDIDSDNRIQFNNFNYFDTDDRDVFADLLQKLDIVYFLDSADSTTWQPSAIDDYINYVTAPPLAIGLNHEVLTIEFGNSLDWLWKRSRSVLKSNEFKRHIIDEPLVQENDVYKTDPITGSIVLIDNGVVKYEKIYNKGDLLFDDNGFPAFKHRIGDIVYDELGNPVPVEESGILRQLDLLLVDGVYLLANDSSSTRYRKQIAQSIVTWVVDELGDFNERSLDQTRIYLYPKTNLGTVKVLADHSQVMNISANQVFSIQLYVTEAVYESSELRSYLNDATIRTLDTLLANTIVSNSSIITSLKEVYGADVISVAIQGLGGLTTVDTVSLLNGGDRLSIGKKLISLPNNERIVVEDININFIQHHLGDQYVGT